MNATAHRPAVELYYATRMAYFDLADYAMDAETKHLRTAEVKLKMARVVPEFFRVGLLVEFDRIMKSANKCARIAREANYMSNNGTGTRLQNWARIQLMYIHIYFS